MNYQPQHLVFAPEVNPRYLPPYYNVVATPHYGSFNDRPIYPNQLYAPQQPNQLYAPQQPMQYAPPQQGGFGNFINSPNAKAGMASGAGSMLGSLFMPNSSLGPALGGAISPIIYSLFTPEQESTGQLLGQALGGGLGGGFGDRFGGPLGAGIGGGLGGGFGGYLGQRF